MQVGCYSLHVYCDHENHIPGTMNMAEFTGKTEKEALIEARKYGWSTGIGGDICPKCRIKWAKEKAE